MIEKLLIANRGEIACRIMRTAQAMGIETIAIYSEADRHARHVREADEAHYVGPAPATDSYLRMARILSIAKEAGADAIHPGYGFLSENAEFAQLTADAGMIFVGPTPDAIRAMGLKDKAKQIMADADVPVVPGYHGANQNTELLKRKAYEIGYPLLIKAVAGGGGKGMRKVEKALEFDSALDAARREAEAAFGNSDVLIERFVESPRHIEIQVFGDSHGNVVHLFERDCSLQRRHQKVIEEAPAPGMTDELRSVMGKAACDAARAVNYQGAGTVEFIVDGSNGLSEDGFFFMEMNTRLQVEHPVTEMITGVDLVEWQLRVAQGEELPLKQDELSISGHAIEARVYAEDPTTGFLPSTGKIHAFLLEQMASDLEDNDDGQLRVDSGVAHGDEISPHYDPMIAKVIAHAEDRDTALFELSSALSLGSVVGPTSNVPFLISLLENKDFVAEQFDTGLIDRNLDDLIKRPAVKAAELAEVLTYLLGVEPKPDSDGHPLPHGENPSSVWNAKDGFQLSGNRELDWHITVNGEAQTVRLRFNQAGLQVRNDDGNWVGPDYAHVLVKIGDAYVLENGGWQTAIGLPVFDASDEASSGSADGSVRVPMHGKIISLTVADGDEVEQGDILFSVEAMKMEHAVIAPVDGKIEGLAIKVDDQVENGQVALRVLALAEA